MELNLPQRVARSFLLAQVASISDFSRLHVLLVGVNRDLEKPQKLDCPLTVL
jgi:hypothetical protein